MERDPAPDSGDAASPESAPDGTMEGSEMSENPQDVSKPQLDETTKKALRRLTAITWEIQKRRRAAAVAAAPQEAPESAEDEAPEEAKDEAPEEALDSGAGKPAPAPRDGPWLRPEDEPTRTEKLRGRLGYGKQYMLDMMKLRPDELSGRVCGRHGGGEVEGGAGAFLAEFFDAAMEDGIGEFADAAWLFGAFSCEETWRRLRDDMAWIWNERAGCHEKASFAPQEAPDVVSDIDRIRECTRLGEPALFRGTGFGEEVPFSEVAGYLRGRGRVSGDGTGFWFEHAWKKLADAGLTRITADNPREMVAVHTETLAMLTEEFQALMLDEEEVFEYDGDGNGFLSFRQQRMALDSIDTEEAAQLREEFQVADEEAREYGEEGWEPEWEQEHDLAACILEDDRRRVAEAVGIDGDAFAALYLSCRFPTWLFEEFADEIEASYPVDADWLRGKWDVESPEEYERLLRDRRVLDAIYEADWADDPAKHAAFEWCEEGTRRLAE